MDKFTNSYMGKTILASHTKLWGLAWSVSLRKMISVLQMFLLKGQPDTER